MSTSTTPPTDATKPAKAAKAATARRGLPSTPQARPVEVRAARRADLKDIVAIDRVISGEERADYWQQVFRRYGSGEHRDSRFLVAVAEGTVIGLIIGEVRDWEFGSPPCGWIFAIEVDPAVRQRGVGVLLLDAIAAQFRRAGVHTIRTVLERENTLILSFFRSQGMVAGPLLSLEMEIDN